MAQGADRASSFNGDGFVREGRHPERWGEASNVIWKVALPGRGWSQPVTAKGPKFKLLASNRLDESLFWASAAFTGDRLILRSMEHLYCIGKPSR